MGRDTGTGTDAPSRLEHRGGNWAGAGDERPEVAIAVVLAFVCLLARRRRERDGEVVEPAGSGAPGVGSK
jgi:hypothetical protein